MNNIKKGKDCENTVCKYLENNGYEIISRNFHCLGGEIDIIAKKIQLLAFVEVKSFPSSWPTEDISLKVSYSKQMKIKKTASVFLETQAHIKYDNLRFDIATVCGNEVSYYEGAF